VLILDACCLLLHINTLSCATAGDASDEVTMHAYQQHATTTSTSVSATATNGATNGANHHENEHDHLNGISNNSVDVIKAKQGQQQEVHTATPQ
jgi:hypothetical protein